MDQKIEIKEELVWCEDTPSTSLDCYGLVSQKTHLKDETKTELAQPGRSQVNTFEPLADVKDEICIVEPTVGQLVPLLKEENNVQNAAVLTVPHSGEKPYRCEQGSSAFSHQASYQRHKLFHSGQRPFRCEECSITFTNGLNLRSHMKTHSGERPYRCEDCNSTFTQQGYLRKHMKTHSGERPYRCEDCNSTFTQQGYLREHMKTHSGEKPCRCEECGRTFAVRYDLRRHMFTHV